VPSPGKTGIGALLLLVAGMMPASCGGTARKASTPRPPHHATAAGTARSTAHSGRPVGVTQRAPAPGTTLAITVTRVIDPLLHSGAKIPARDKAVGVVVSARNAGPGGYDSSATSDFALLSAAGRAMPVYVPTGVCQTYIQDFMNELGAGQARTGCIGFAVPVRDAPTTVRFSPEGGTTGVVRSWKAR